MGTIRNLGVLLLMYLVSVVAHEYTHGVIAESYGCQNISYGVQIDGLDTGFYTSYRCKPNDGLELAQNINEIVGYNIVPFLLLIVYFLMEMGDDRCRLDF